MFPSNLCYFITEDYKQQSREKKDYKLGCSETLWKQPSGWRWWGTFKKSLRTMHLRKNESFHLPQKGMLYLEQRWRKNYSAGMRKIFVHEISQNLTIGLLTRRGPHLIQISERLIYTPLNLARPLKCILLWYMHHNVKIQLD